jgi:hypothetical protein
MLQKLRNRRVIIAALALATLALGALLSFALWKADGPPLPPGAFDIKEIARHNDYRSTWFYISELSPEEVFLFYKQLMDERGWVVGCEKPLHDFLKRPWCRDDFWLDGADLYGVTYYPSSDPPPTPGYHAYPSIDIIYNGQVGKADGPHFFEIREFGYFW